MTNRARKGLLTRQSTCSRPRWTKNSPESENESALIILKLRKLSQPPDCGFPIDSIQRNWPALDAQRTVFRFR
jgi:hypothetical protein